MENLLWYNVEAKHFEEALPLGNGKIGAMVYGRCDIEKISLNADSLWTGHPGESKNEGAFEAYTKMKKLFNEGKKYEAQELLSKGFGGKEVEAYLPAGNLFIKTGDDNATDYRRSLNLENAIADSRYICDGAVKTETFISAADDVLVHSIASEQKKSFDIWLESPLKNSVSANGDVLFLTGKAPDVRRNEKPELFTYDRDDTVKFTIAVKPVTDGNIKISDGKIKVSGSTHLVLYLTVKTSYIDWDIKPDKEHFIASEKAVKAAAEKGIERIRQEHIEDFSTYYNRVKISISDNKNDIPTDERVKAENKDIGLVELLFNFGRYLVISSSRAGSLATNLQGIWNEEIIAPWGSEYTTNINTQMNYWPVLMCNLPEFMMPLLDLIKMISHSGKETAKTYYNVDTGFVAHHNYDIWGKTSPSPGSPRWSYWCMSSGWMCRHLFEYYQYTGDVDFLENTAFPIIYEAAKFYMEILEERNGKLVISPSTSPENAYIYEGKTLHLADYTTMTQSILIDLFSILAKTCEILKKDDLKAEIEKKYPVDIFNTYTIGSKGQLLEYDDEYEEEEVHHRHVSHLYAMHPGEDITTDDAVLSEACKKSLLIRGDEGTGWSMGWKVNLWAKLKDGNHALKMVRNQLSYVGADWEINYNKGGTYANMFDAHPPFQIDGNFGITAGIAQMFLQCENETVKILPALPDEICSGYVKGLLAKGNITVDISWSNNTTKLKMISPIKQTVKYNIKNGEVYETQLDANKAVEINY